MAEKVKSGDAGAKYAPYAMTKDIVRDMFPVESEPKIPTMDKPLIIESACPGFQIGGARFPAVPISLKGQIKAKPSL
jgi:hypothetical protein